jgi:hypothetical protein
MSPEKERILELIETIVTGLMCPPAKAKQLCLEEALILAAGPDLFHKLKDIHGWEGVVQLNREQD